MPIKYPGVQIQRNRHGNVRFYFRAGRGAPRVRLHKEYGSKEFLEELACARMGVPYKGAAKAAKPLKTLRDGEEGSLAWLVEQYKKRGTKELAPVVRGRRWRVLDEICQSKHKGRPRGTLPYALMERKHVIEIRDELRDTPGARNDFIKTMSAMFGWAIEAGIAKVNPVTGIKREKSGDGFHTWTVDEVEQFIDRHRAGTRGWLYLHLALFTGLRLQELAHPRPAARQERLADHPAG